MARIVWLTTGLMWATRSLLEFAHPDYMDPSAALDWVAVWLYSAAWLMLAASVLLVARLVATREVTVAATIVATGAIAAGVANGLEDGLGMSSFGVLYVVGFMVGWLGLLGLAASLQRATCVRLAGLTLAIFVGVASLTLGGGVIVLMALGSLAAAPAWFTAAPDTTETTGTLGSR